MISRHIVLYLGSKALAAVVNLVTMAMFVRLGGVESYGHYVVAVAWAYIVYGSTLQWLRFAFFAIYREDSGEALIATYFRALGLGFVGIAALAALMVAVGHLQPVTTASIVVLVMSLAIYDALHEMSRTRLQAGSVAAGVIVRSAMMLILGILALQMFGTATALVFAVAFAHFAAIVPMLLNLRGLLGGKWSQSAASRLVGYGLPLMPAFFLDGIGLQFDRLLLARSGNLVEVGSYGAVADFIRQMMIVVSEAISGAYMAIARADMAAGREDEAVVVLAQAFLAFVALTAFGAAVILRFDRLLIDTMFGSAIGATVEPVVGLIVLSCVLHVFRAYYFGQVLYLTEDSRLLTLSNAVHCALMVGLGFALTGRYGMHGVALALALAHLGGCLVYVYAWRGTFALRLPFAKALAIAAMAAGAFAVTGAIAQATTWQPLAAGLNLVVFAFAALFAAQRYNLLSFNDLVTAARDWVRV